MGKRNPKEYYHELRQPAKPDMVLAAVVVKYIKEMSHVIKKGA